MADVAARRRAWAGAAFALLALAGPGPAGAAIPPVQSALAAGQFAAARAAADSALAARERRARHRPLAAAAFADSLGNAFFAAGAPEALEAAAACFERALALRERALGPRALPVAKSAGTLAVIHDYLGRFEDALRLERRALAIHADSLPTADPRIAAGHRQVSSLLFYLGRYDQAAEAIERALAAQDLGGAPDPTARVDALTVRGEIARVRDRYPEAEDSFRRALAIADSAAGVDPLTHAALVNNFAGLYKDLARYDEAEPLLERSLRMRRALENRDPDALATAELNRAEVLRLQGRLAEAAPGYAAALDLSRQARGAEHVDRIPILAQAAVLETALGRFARAESLFAEAEALARRSLGAGHPVLAQTLHDRADLLAARGDRAAADSVAALALDLRERVLGADHPDAAVTRVLRARVLAGHDDDAAARHLERALAVLERSPWYPEATLEALALEARAAERAGDRDGAIRRMRAATGRVDLLRASRGGGAATRAAFLGSQLALYDDLIAWQLEAGDVAGAFESRERARARALLDQIAGGGVDFRSGVPAAELAELDRATGSAERRLAQAQRRIEEARFSPGPEPAARWTEIARLEAARDSAAWDLQMARERVRDRSPLWRQLLSAEGQVASLAETQRDLVPRRGALLAYHVGARRSWVFVVPPAGRPPAVIELSVSAGDAARFGVATGPLTGAALERMVLGDPGSAEPAGRVGVAAELSGERRLDRARAPGAGAPDRREQRLHALWRTLAPEAVWRAARRAEEIVLLPDGALHLLPFEALVVRVRDKARPARYWLDEGPAIAYGASATSMLALERRPRGGARSGPFALSVCDPEFGPAAPVAAAAGTGTPSPGAWPALPATRAESERVVRALAPESVLVLAGRAATESRVRAALTEPRLLHFATHGFVTESRGDLLAGLALAPGTGAGSAAEDGLLQLYEIYDLTLRCDLAVLSACETHRGPRVAGEGVYALSRGFLAAGARRVVASLWPVSDDAAAALVGATFDGIAADLRRGREPRVCLRLRDARRLVKNEGRWSDPSFWSAFVMSGAR